MTRLDFALLYLRRGWSVIPIPKREKRPRLKGWQKLRLIEADARRYFSGEGNLGINLGSASGGLADIDLDCPEASWFAPNLLPATNAIFGRTSKPRSHWLYRVSGPAPSLQFKDPTRGDMLLELRADGGRQTVFPPSIHPEGELIEWVCGDVPATVEYATLEGAAKQLAVQSLAARYLPAVSNVAELRSKLDDVDQRLARQFREWLGLPQAAGPSARPTRHATDEPDCPVSGSLPPWLNGRFQRDTASAAVAGINDTQWTPEFDARVRSALSFIPAKDRQTRVQVGMALHATGWTNAFEIWGDWLHTYPEKYNDANQQRNWKSFGRPRDGLSITLGTLFHLAEEYGWEDEGPTTHLDKNKRASAVSQSNEANGSTALSCFPSMISAADLRTMEFEPVRYVLPKFIPEGVALLAGRPKIGKSWLVLDLCLAAAAETYFAGIKPRGGDVLYLALEDGKRRLKRRIDKLVSLFSGEWPAQLKLVPMGGWRRADHGGLEDIEAWCRSVPNPTLVVVDTLERFRKPASSNGTLYRADYDALSGLQRIASDFKIGIVVLHHDRKSDAEDAFDTISGTLGLSGAADTILMLKRRANGIVLYARGRDIEESETALLFDKGTCHWTILGAAAEVLRSTERARVIAAIKAIGKPLSTKEIMSEADMPNRNAVDLLLTKMVRDGEIARVGRARYDLSVATSGQNGQKERFYKESFDSTEKT